MQLFPHLLLQGRLGADTGAAHFAVSHPPSTGPVRCAAFLRTRGEESIMYNHSTVLVAAGSLYLTGSCVGTRTLKTLGFRASSPQRRESRSSRKPAFIPSPAADPPFWPPPEPG